MPRFHGVRAHDANRVWRIVQINGLIETVEMGRIESNLLGVLQSGGDAESFAQEYLRASLALPSIHGDEERTYRQHVSTCLAIASIYLNAGFTDEFSAYSTKAMELIANRGDYHLSDMVVPLLNEIDPIDEAELTIMGPLDLE